VPASEIPQQNLDDKRGWIKVVVGKYANLVSKIPNYAGQFLYHIHLEAGKQFSLTTENGLEYAAFLLNDEVLINDTEYEAGEFIEFDRNGGTIEMTNHSEGAIDILLFGGEHYAEPIVAQGPFVMNTQAEIAQAYKDFHEGKYGTIDYARNN
jgi:redox-sensitive bicupin YhaK (pirin superfamily)